MKNAGIVMYRRSGIYPGQKSASLYFVRNAKSFCILVNGVECQPRFKSRPRPCPSHKDIKLFAEFCYKLYAGKVKLDTIPVDEMASLKKMDNHLSVCEYDCPKTFNAECKKIREAEETNQRRL